MIRQIAFENEIDDGSSMPEQNIPTIINGFVNSAGYLCRFPGYDYLFDYDNIYPINGIFSAINTEHDDSETIFVANNGFLYSRYYYLGSYAGTSVLNHPDSFPNLNLSPTNPLIFDYTRSDLGYLQCVVADGTGAPVILGLGSDYGRCSDPEAPSPCSHVATVDTYLIGNNVGEQYFDISYPGDFSRWDGDFATAQSRPDDIVAMCAVRRKIAVMGTEICEIWANDGSTPFVPEYNHIYSGCSAKYSFVNCDNVLYWIDQSKRLVACDIAQSVTPVTVSASINRILSSGAVGDCIGGYLRVGSDGYYIATLTSLRKTIAVNVKNGKWFELGLWDSLRGEYGSFPLYTFTTTQAAGTVAGSRIDATAYRLSPDYNTFYGNEIRTLFRSNIIVSGATRSVVNKLIICVKRTGEQPSEISITPEIRVRWRDDGATNWSPWRTASISPTGRTDWQIDLYRCGSYKFGRQYELILLGELPYCVSFFGEEVR